MAEKDRENVSQTTGGKTAPVDADVKVPNVVEKVSSPDAKPDFTLADNRPKEESWRRYMDESVRDGKSDEELAEEKKKYRRNQIINAVGEGLSALTNLFFTTRGAPSMYRYDPKDSAIARTKEKYEKMLADNDAQRLAYRKAEADAKAMDAKEKDRTWRLWLEGQKLKMEQDKAKMEEAAHNLNMAILGQREKKAGYDAEAAGTRAKYAPEYEESRIKKNNADADTSTARGNYYRSGGSGSGKYYGRFMDKDYRTKEDYEKAVQAAAREYGVETDETVVTERNYRGEPRKTTKKKIPTAKVAAEIERVYREREKENTVPPSRRRTGDNTPPSKR